MNKLAVCILLLVSLLLSGCGYSEVCGNNVCEAAERQLGTCPQDCLYIPQPPSTSLPDFLVEQVIGPLDGTSPVDKPKVGQEVTFKALIRNQGDLPGDLNLQWDIQDFVDSTNQMAVPNTMQPGDEVEIWKTGQFSSVGQKRVTLAVDPTNSVMEKDDNNNEVTISVYISDQDGTTSLCTQDNCNAANPPGCQCGESGQNQTTTRDLTFCCAKNGVVYQYEPLCQAFCQ